MKNKEFFKKLSGSELNDFFNHLSKIGVNLMDFHHSRKGINEEVYYNVLYHYYTLYKK